MLHQAPPSAQQVATLGLPAKLHTVERLSRQNVSVVHSNTAAV
jgi:hypothetical protein